MKSALAGVAESLCSRRMLIADVVHQETSIAIEVEGGMKLCLL